MLLIVGGDADPNIEAVQKAAGRAGADHCTALVGEATNAGFSWDLNTDALRYCGETVSPTSAFIRQDVFTHLRDQRPESYARAFDWHSSFLGWALAHPEVRLLNRQSALQSTNKPHVLHLARQQGLEIPGTEVTNHLDEVEERSKTEQLVAKPVNGGGYCQGMEELLPVASRKDGLGASPAIVQERLVPPEVRVFCVGDKVFAFSVVCDALDYRSAAASRVEPLDSSTLEVCKGLQRLTRLLHLNFCAADFKACPESGGLLFLEVNSAPMFAAFDRACDGRLSDAIVNYLVEGTALY